MKDDTEAKRWIALLRIIAARNRGRLGENAYQAILSRIEHETDPQQLRKVALHAATAIGRAWGGGKLSQPNALDREIPSAATLPAAQPAMTPSSSDKHPGRQRPLRLAPSPRPSMPR